MLLNPIPFYFLQNKGEDENEDEAEDRSDLEVDEETRQYIEMYDVYGRHLSPSIPELERDNESDILMIQYADNGRDGGSANAVSANSVGVSVNVNVDVDNDQPSSSNSNVPSTSGINRVCDHKIIHFSFMEYIQRKFRAKFKFE